MDALHDFVEVGYRDGPARDAAVEEAGRLPGAAKRYRRSRAVA